MKSWLWKYPFRQIRIYSYHCWAIMMINRSLTNVLDSDCLVMESHLCIWIDTSCNHVRKILMCYCIISSWFTANGRRTSYHLSRWILYGWGLLTVRILKWWIWVIAASLYLLPKALIQWTWMIICMFTFFQLHYLNQHISSSHLRANALDDQLLCNISLPWLSEAFPLIVHRINGGMSRTQLLSCFHL